MRVRGLSDPLPTAEEPHLSECDHDDDSPGEQVSESPLRLGQILAEILSVDPDDERGDEHDRRNGSREPAGCDVLVVLQLLHVVADHREAIFDLFHEGGDVPGIDVGVGDKDLELAGEEFTWGGRSIRSKIDFIASKSSEDLLRLCDHTPHEGDFGSLQCDPVAHPRHALLQDLAFAVREPVESIESNDATIVIQVETELTHEVLDRDVEVLRSVLELLHHGLQHANEGSSAGCVAVGEYPVGGKGLEECRPIAGALWGPGVRAEHVIVGGCEDDLVEFGDGVLRIRRHVQNSEEVPRVLLDARKGVLGVPGTIQEVMSCDPVECDAGPLFEGVDGCRH